MNRPLEIFVPGKVRGKQRARILKNGFSFTPNQTVEYENLIKIIFKQKYPLHKPIRDNAIDVHLSVYYSIPKSYSKKQKELISEGKLLPTKKPDADNILKVFCDALNKIAYEDDCQVVKGSFEKKYAEKEGVSLILWTINNNWKGQ